MLSLRMALSLKCTRLVFTKILWSSICFNTFQGFVFLGRIRYEFLKVSATWSSTRGRRQAITWAALNAPRWSRALNNEPCFVIQWERVLFKSHQRSQSRLDVRLVSAATVNHSLHYFTVSNYICHFPPPCQKTAGYILWERMHKSKRKCLNSSICSSGSSTACLASFTTNSDSLFTASHTHAHTHTPVKQRDSFERDVASLYSAAIYPRVHDGWMEALSSLTDFLRYPTITHKNASR